MALSVIDNLIVAHHLRTGVALVIDVRAPSNPLAPPLPVGISSKVRPQHGHREHACNCGWLQLNSLPGFFACSCFCPSIAFA